MSDAKVFKVADLYHSCNGDALVVDAEIHHVKLAALLANNESLSAELAWSENDSRDQSKEITALREELAKADNTIRIRGEQNEDMGKLIESQQQRLADAERRNAIMADLLRVCGMEFSTSEANAWEIMMREKINAALNKPEEAKS